MVLGAPTGEPSTTLNCANCNVCQARRHAGVEPPAGERSDRPERFMLVRPGFRRRFGALIRTVAHVRDGSEKIVRAAPKYSRGAEISTA